jgi:hypothetical protein
MPAETFPILTSAGEVVYDRINPSLLASFKPLPIQHEKYFIVDSTTKYLPVSALVFSRARSEGIAKANVLMRESSEGRCTRRGPITVRALDRTRFHVIDGNSTAMNALLSGWPDIPADIQAS